MVTIIIMLATLLTDYNEQVYTVYLGFLFF